MSENFLKTTFPPVLEPGSPGWIVPQLPIPSGFGIPGTVVTFEGETVRPWKMRMMILLSSFPLLPCIPWGLRSENIPVHHWCQRPDSGHARRRENRVYAVLMRRQAHSLLLHKGSGQTHQLKPRLDNGIWKQTKKRRKISWTRKIWCPKRHSP